MIKPRRIVTGIDDNGESEIKINSLIEPDIINGDNIFLEYGIQMELVLIIKILKIDLKEQ